MAFSTQAIKYGWVALTSLGVLTGVAIYVANNQRRQIKPEDIIQPVLGTVERCLTTQYSTNPVSYYVDPPSFVRTWYSNVYTTNGVAIYTNIVTNTIGWHLDRDMMVSLDATIKALVPYFCDTNTVYDGTTNIVMLTVTGLWASLGIGNKTNLFTREPCWTNPISTNWIVNYTSYWPSTNGTATNVNYTSDYRQVVNYAQSWTATGGHVWVSASNWASVVVTVTNAVTYGELPWRIYVEDLQERYKVLNALSIYKPNLTEFYFYYASSYQTSSWEEAKSGAESLWNSGNYNAYSNSFLPFPLVLYGGQEMGGGQYKAAIMVTTGYVFFGQQSKLTNLNRLELRMRYYNNSPDVDFNKNWLDSLINDGSWDLIKIDTEYPISGRITWNNLLDLPVAVDEPVGIKWRGVYGGQLNPTFLVLIYWNFQYCTNAYWE